MNKILNFDLRLTRWWFDVWVDPWLWITVGTVFFGLTLLGTRPIVPPKNEEAGIFTHAAVHIRQLLLWVFVISTVLIQLFVAAVASHRYSAAVALPAMLERITDRMLHWWEFPVMMWAASGILVITWKRFISVKLSSLKRRLRLRQTGEELSDIRIEGDKLKPKTFDPEVHFKKGQVFLGLDANNQPIYMPLSKWRSMHMKIIGPTQTGKGVILGVLTAQAIRNGDCVFAIDPKPDKHLKAIMKETAKATGRKFLELDLNDGAKHRWAPFAGGTERHRRARILSAFGLADTGEQADFYKSGERALLDELLPSWGGDLLSLKNRIEHGNIAENMKRTLSNINEWLAISTFSPQKGRGFSIEKALRENAVVWIRGSLDDPMIMKAATIFIMELMQEGLRLANERKTHLFCPIDEVRFMVSDTLADALATVSSFNINLALSYQSVLDLLALRDKKLNAKSIAASINVNCKITMCYQAADSDTAEWASKLSGTIQKSVTRMETLKTGRYGAEEWDKDRMVAKLEVPLISENVMQALPERVCVLFRPNTLAQPLFTGWVKVSDEALQDANKALVAIPVALAKEPTEEEAEPCTSAPPPGAAVAAKVSPAASSAKAAVSNGGKHKKRKKRTTAENIGSVPHLDDADEAGAAASTDPRENSVDLDDVMVQVGHQHHDSAAMDLDDVD